jgi:hypothetical protein
MKPILIILSVLLAVFARCQNQPTAVKGRVYDTAFNKGLAYATVSVVKATDSTLVSFTRADSTGKFTIAQIGKGNFILSASYVGFATVWQPFTVKDNQTTDLGNIALTDVKKLADITVNTKRPPVTINNDTLEFNTENFKTAPNAVVEDLLKRLPGVVIEADGTVKVNGQTVRRVLVDGKEFFTGDPKIATQNLDASAIDKVQVFDRKSDRAQFTGIDDGNSEKAINLKLKKDRKNATFGRVTAGANGNDRFESQANINRFNGDKQMSLIGMGNNTNKQGFSISDVLNFTGELSRGMRNGGGVTIRVNDGSNDNGLPVTGLGQNQQGVAETYAGGINYNNYFNKKTDLNSNVLLSDIRLNTQRNTSRQSFLQDGTSNFYNGTSNALKHNQQQRLNFVLDQKIDTFTSLKITPQLTFQKNNNNTSTGYATVNSNNTKLNDGITNTNSNANAVNFTNTALFRRRFARKGRTLSATITNAYNNSTSTGDQYTKNTFYTNGTNGKDSIIYQQNSRDAISRSFGSLVTYTEPLGKKSLLEFSGFYNTSSGESNRKTLDFNGLSGKFDAVNTNLTNDFSNNYTYAGGTFNVRTNLPKFTYSAGASVQAATLTSNNNSKNSSIKQSFTDVLPSANIQYKPNQSSSLGINYTTSTQQPTTMQLQPIADISDPLNIVYGKADLKRSYQQSITLNYFSTNIYKQRNLFTFISGNITNNAIVYADSIYSNGARVSRPTNVNGNYFLVGNVNYGFGIKKLKSRVELGISSNISRNIGFVNGVKNTIDYSTIGPTINYNFSLDNKIDIRASGRLNISSSKNSLQPQLSNNFLQQVYSYEMTNYLPAGFIVTNNFSYTINSGRADGFNNKVPLWNASVAKSFLKNKRAELKLSAFDLLNKNLGINRNANLNYIEDVSYNVLQQYFLLSFTFSLNKAGKSSGGPNVMIRTFN